jgi:hypothetical protein
MQKLTSAGSWLSSSAMRRDSLVSVNKNGRSMKSKYDDTSPTVTAHTAACSTSTSLPALQQKHSFMIS